MPKTREQLDAMRQMIRGILDALPSPDEGVGSDEVFGLALEHSWRDLEAQLAAANASAAVMQALATAAQGALSWCPVCAGGGQYWVWGIDESGTRYRIPRQKCPSCEALRATLAAAGYGAREAGE